MWIKKGFQKRSSSFFMHHQEDREEKEKNEAENLKKIRKTDGDYG